MSNREELPSENMTNLPANLFNQGTLISINSQKSQFGKPSKESNNAYNK